MGMATGLLRLAQGRCAAECGWYGAKPPSHSSALRPPLDLRHAHSCKLGVAVATIYPVSCNCQLCYCWIHTADNGRPVLRRRRTCNASGIVGLARRAQDLGWAEDAAIVPPDRYETDAAGAAAGQPTTLALITIHCGLV